VAVYGEFHMAAVNQGSQGSIADDVGPRALALVGEAGALDVSEQLLGVEAPVRWTDSLTITRQPELSLR
jgi:hypothetical protein